MAVSINHERIELFKQEFESDLTWKDIEEIYDWFRKDAPIDRFSVIGTAICRSEINEKINYLKNLADGWHPGNFIDAMTIIQFENITTGRSIPDEAKSIHSKFRQDTPDELPEWFDLNMLTPVIHSDPVDGIFFQLIGTVLWKMYYDDGTIDSRVLQPGDVLVVPKNIRHSVESLEPRCSLSVSFTDA
jgi:mannose-6-phosphate isomerase-like protein (cupin superfamily)